MLVFQPIELFLDLLMYDKVRIRNSAEIFLVLTELSTYAKLVKSLVKTINISAEFLVLILLFIVMYSPSNHPALGMRVFNFDIRGRADVLNLQILLSIFFFFSKKRFIYQTFFYYLSYYIYI